MSFVPALRFHALTPLYDAVVALTTRERTVKETLLAHVRLGAGQRVLDVGCGTGTLACLAKARCPGAYVAGLDADPRMLARARRKAARAGLAVRFHAGMATALPFPEGAFDRVLASLLLHHLTGEQKRAALAEARRVLRPGGELWIADFGRAASVLRRAAFLSVRLLDGLATTADHAAGRLPGMLAAAGLGDVRCTVCIPTPVGTIDVLGARRG